MKYRKKPIVIEAIQFTGDNWDEIDQFMDGLNWSGYYPEGSRPPILNIKTLKGVMKASVSDWIIKGVNGEFYPCKPDIFEKTYEKVN